MNLVKIIIGFIIAAFVLSAILPMFYEIE